MTATATFCVFILLTISHFALANNSQEVFYGLFGYLRHKPTAHPLSSHWDYRHPFGGGLYPNSYNNSGVKFLKNISNKRRAGRKLLIPGDIRNEDPYFYPTARAVPSPPPSPSSHPLANKISDMLNRLYYDNEMRRNSIKYFMSTNTSPVSKLLSYLLFGRSGGSGGGGGGGGRSITRTLVPEISKNRATTATTTANNSPKRYIIYLRNLDSNDRILPKDTNKKRNKIIVKHGSSSTTKTRIATTNSRNQNDSIQQQQPHQVISKLLRNMLFSDLKNLHNPSIDDESRTSQPQPHRQGFKGGIFMRSMLAV
ncbi:hypothetical protein H4219_005510 [Mycoemilia scoparia]|uniref:Uncharacterized protein n=1 Tax=Mycoemilia scoparia TaxID=417184 RepID=A0A9W8DP59_9FUNG|nr:hypothetical protein H4219_005510 [Mycoemilia scoparia]